MTPDSAHARNGRENDATIRLYRRATQGRAIRRSIERRFDAILTEIVRSDPEKVRQRASARWLLDNSHIVRQALQHVETDLPRTFMRQLQLADGSTAWRRPRVFELVDSAVIDSLLPIDCGSLQSVCRNYRSVEGAIQHLTLGELWAVPIALRITLLLHLCAAAEVDLAGIDDDSVSVERDANTTTIAGCITSLKTVATFDWPDFVEHTSVVERTLGLDPSNFYKRMDFATRDRYRGEIERIAARAPVEQCDVAAEALKLARRAKKDAQSENRQHVGYYLIDKGRHKLEAAAGYRSSLARRCKHRLNMHSDSLYLLSISGLTAWGCTTLMLVLLADGASLAISALVALLTLFPAMSVCSGAVNFFLSIAVAPRRLAKLDFGKGLPADQQSIVVMPMMLSSAADIAANLHTLELNYLGNSDPQLHFALLSDFPDASNAEMPADKVLLEQALKGIDQFNTRYEASGRQPFLLFHRRRVWNENAQYWMGWERKRGKLEEFNELLGGSTDTSYTLQRGDETFNLQDIHYVITLDADSYMPPGTASRLIGAMLHPLNRARFDERSKRVVSGYTVIQPRLEINPVTGADTVFSKIFAGDVMLDLYTHAVSNVYQDLFGDAIFAGKGIYDVDAFRRCTAQRVPTNAVLSHDLLEGLLGRAALASDILILEDYPSSYLAYLKRLHRWVRGDWQLIPWLFSTKPHSNMPFTPGLIGRWKLFDNLRRSLVPPAMLGLLILGWQVLPGNPLYWTLFFALFPGLPILLRITLAFRTSLWRWGTIESSARNLIEHAGADAARWLLALVFLPVEAYAVCDAILRTVHRVSVSKQHLLEWSTAAHVSRDLGASHNAVRFWRGMWFGPAVAIGLGISIFLLNSQALMVACPLLLLWLCSPVIAMYLGRHVNRQPGLQLSEPDILLVRSIAHDTWRFFERFVGPETQWLPPDNVQEYPTRTVAGRTSPTNIGMMLLSTLTAYDFGYLGQHQLLARLSNHAASLGHMQKYRGHLFNWYSTNNLKPLEPRYVSTVDSGNFVAALITTRQALEDLPSNEQPIERIFHALSDELAALRRQLFSVESPASDTSMLALIHTLDTAQSALAHTDDQLARLQEFEQLHCGAIEEAFLHALERDPTCWSAEEIANFRENAQVLRQRIRIILEDIDLFAPWSERFSRPPALLLRSKYEAQFTTLSRLLDAVRDTKHLEDRYRTAGRTIIDLLRNIGGGDSRASCAARSWLAQLQLDIPKALTGLQTLDASRRKLIHDFTGLIDETNFRFLYDTGRDLFRVGYNASTGEADSSYYDLLASEARIASLVAIANGGIPPKHWMHLGRPLTRRRGLRILLSWSATAFEYLMPRLIMHSPPSGLLDQSCEGAVREQIRFGHEHGIPWGISESGYAQFDAQNHYQYFAFGIPNLGLKWDQGERLVVSGYSSVLALPYAPAEVVRNLRWLMQLDGAGHFGLYEALDFGVAHQPRAPRPRVVQSYMAHHQGMILVAIGNALHQDVMLRRFHQDPRIASVEYLLYERLPQRLQTRPLERLPSPLKELPAPRVVVTQWPVESNEPELAVLANGRLSCRVSDQGGSALYWRGMAVTRWNPLAEGPLGGSCVYIKNLDDGHLQCIGSAPLADDADVLFAPHIADFRVQHSDMLLRMTITVAPADDVEIRQVTITNESHAARHILLCYYSEPVLSSESADQRHPAFSKLFVEAQLLEDQDILLFRRRSREHDQPSTYLAQTAIVPAGCVLSREIEVDRRSFIGRGGDRTKPAAMVDSSYRFSDEGNASLDPCAALAITLEIASGSTVQCAFLAGVGDSRESAVQALQPFRSLDRVAWTVEAARLYSERELTGLRADSKSVRESFKLLGRILWPRTLPHIAPGAFKSVHQVQDCLWRHGVSGDRPIVTMVIDSEDDLKAVETLLQSINYLSRKNFALDAVFLDQTEGGYTFPTNDRLRRLVDTELQSGRERDGAYAYIIPARNLSAEEKTNLIAAARLFIDTPERTSDAALSATDQYYTRIPAFVPQPSSPLSIEAIAPVKARDDLLFENRFGGMLANMDGYSIMVSKKSRTPAPWCNVLANADFGTLVSESGSMCTWWGNSSEKRLTPWSNDPVLDRTGEAIYVRDEESGDFWSLTPQPRSGGSPYRVTHAIGESLFEHASHGIEQQLRVFVDAENPLKFLRVKLANKWKRDRRLTVTFAVEWLLGNSHAYERHLLLPERDPDTGALLVRNGYARLGHEEVAFVASELPAHGVSCDGIEFFGKQYSWERPVALAAVGLSGRVAPSARPCAAYQVHLNLRPEETREFHFVLGAAKNRLAAIELIRHSCRADWVDKRYTVLRQGWEALLGTWQVKTADIAADAMINRWLLYQVVSSRLWGRIGFYQASGGFGFRDQLQDVLALLDANPEIAREHILLSASRQFEEGDVLHWWHEAPLRGVRTRISDDLLWLPYAVCEYIQVTDDPSILDSNVSFLHGEPLDEHELERYAEYQAGPLAASIYEHCYRAIDARIKFGAHGIPFIGTGDWNDGLNRVGAKGRGESVWMAWFLVIICRRFAPLCRRLDDDSRADYYENIATNLLRATQKNAWAGRWYLRGYFDDGTPLGHPGDDESEIDLNAQTWAVFADPGDPSARQAIDAVEETLVDADHRLIKLLSPPFQKTTTDPGYIRSYPPGVRENGGQYTHAAVWAPWAAVELGDKHKAMRWFEWLNPLKRARTDEEIDRYRLEPYVMPGDIYSVGGYAGRGGWSWYTGSAAWLYRFAIRQMLGLQRQGDRLFVRPCLPGYWRVFEATLRHNDAEHRFRVHDPSDIHKDQLFIIQNGTAIDVPSIDLQNNGIHDYEIFASDAARQTWLAEHPLCHRPAG